MIMAVKVGKASVTELAVVDATQRNPLGTIVQGANGEEFIYMVGVASNAIGKAVTYDEAGVTTLLVTNAVGPVAISMSAAVAAEWGWFCILAPQGVDALVAANTAVDTLVGFETTSGNIGDGRAAGDQIYGIICRVANATAAAALREVQIWMHPFVDDIYGS